LQRAAFPLWGHPPSRTHVGGACGMFLFDMLLDAHGGPAGPAIARLVVSESACCLRCHCWTVGGHWSMQLLVLVAPGSSTKRAFQPSN
jgi:hypothetical protein